MVDFDRDFPQPPPREAAQAPRATRRIAFRGEAPVEIALMNPLAVENGDGPATEIERLAIRRITAGEMVEIVEALGRDVEDAVLIRHVTAAMCGCEPDVLAALSPDDAGRVAAAALPFMPAGLVAAIETATGEAMASAEAAGAG